MKSKSTRHLASENIGNVCIGLYVNMYPYSHKYEQNYKRLQSYLSNED